MANKNNFTANNFGIYLDLSYYNVFYENVIAENEGGGIFGIESSFLAFKTNTVKKTNLVFG